MIPPLEKGDLVQVEWVDIYEDTTGNPDAAMLARRHSIGFYWGCSESQGVPVFVTTTTLEVDSEAVNSGDCAYPQAVILAVKVIKRKRRRKKPKPEVTP